MGGGCFRFSAVLDSSDEHIKPWSVSEASLNRYVLHASERCVQELVELSALEETRNGWKYLCSKDGIDISTKKTGEAAVTAIRGRRLLKVSSSRFSTVVNSVNTAKQWDSDFVQGQHILSLNDNVNIYRLIFSGSCSPMLKNREFVVYEKRETMKDGTTVVAFSSLPKAIAWGLVPEDSKRIRGSIMQSGWVIQNVEDPNACLVTFIVQLNPAGWVSKWVVNKRSPKLVMVINGLVRLLGEEKAKQQQLDEERLPKQKDV